MSCYLRADWSGAHCDWLMACRLSCVLGLSPPLRYLKDRQLLYSVGSDSDPAADGAPDSAFDPRLPTTAQHPRYRLVWHVPFEPGD